MKTPRISARALIIKQGSILVAEYKDETGPWYTLPGGGQQYGEDLATCVQRELLEETGLTIEVRQVRYLRESINENGHSVSVIFACAIKDEQHPTPAKNLDLGQIGWRWLELNQLETKRFYPQKMIQLLQSKDGQFVYIGDVN